MQELDESYRIFLRNFGETAYQLYPQLYVGKFDTVEDCVRYSMYKACDDNEIPFFAQKYIDWDNYECTYFENMYRWFYSDDEQHIFLFKKDT
jgi:hypothetical protein